VTGTLVGASYGTGEWLSNPKSNNGDPGNP
jgi:hypothetical protein